jgi:hypothetical protein
VSSPGAFRASSPAFGDRPSEFPMQGNDDIGSWAYKNPLHEIQSRDPPVGTPGRDPR